MYSLTLKKLLIMYNKVKTREQVAQEYGISRRTFYNWLQREGIKLTNRLITPKEQQKIYDKLGRPARLAIR